MAQQRRSDVVLDSVRRLLRIGATANLLNLLQKQHPADLGQIFGELHDSERQAAFAVLVERQPKLAMESVSELGPERGALLLAGKSAEDIVKLVQEIASDDAAALVDYLPEELSHEVLELMRRRESGQVESLLDYAEQTAGRIMNPNVFALSEDLTVAEAVTALQSAINVEMVFYLYVVDARRHLVGVTSLRRLLLVSPETPLKRIMTPDVFSVRVDTDQEEAARLVASYNLLAIPVVDEENKIAGVITVDDVIDVLKDEATEDLYRLAGVVGRRAHRDPGLRGAQEASAVARDQPGHGVSGGLGGRRLRAHDQPGHGARRVHADRGRHGRQRRHPDPDGHRARARAWRAVVGQRPEGALQGGARSAWATAWCSGWWPRSWPGPPRATRCSACCSACRWCATCSWRPRPARWCRSGLKAHEGRPGPGLVGVHHDLHRRGRLRLVPGPGHDLPALPRSWIDAGKRIECAARTASVPLYSADALVLRTYKLGEADRIVVFLTKDRGKKRGVAPVGPAHQVAVHRGAGAPDRGASGVL